MKYNTDPTTTSDMVFANEEAKTTLLDILSQTSPFPIAGLNSLLLYGVFGTGKTTYASIFLNDFEKTFGGSEALIETIVCEKTQNISTILSACNAIANTTQHFNSSNYHYFIFDEVDNLTIGAQRALKSFLNRKNIICVLTTNYLDAIDGGVRARCEEINFNAADKDEYINRFKKILTDNQLPLLCDDAYSEIVRMHNGNWRKMIKTLIWAAKEYEKMNLAA